MMLMVRSGSLAEREVTANWRRSHHSFIENVMGFRCADAEPMFPFAGTVENEPCQQGRGSGSKAFRRWLFVLTKVISRSSLVRNGISVARWEFRRPFPVLGEAGTALHTNTVRLVWTRHDSCA